MLNLTAEELLRYYALLWHFPLTKTRNTRPNRTLQLQHVDCLQTGPKGICRELNVPPLISNGSVPALLYSKKPLVRFELPWGEQSERYAVPVSCCGALRSVCTLSAVDAERKEVVLNCIGRADRRYVRPLEDSAEALGYRLKLNECECYASDIQYLELVAEGLAKRLKEGRVVISTFHPFLHVLLGALTYLVLKTEDVQYLSRVRLAEGLDTNDRGRNAVKYAMHYMCSSGDAVACCALGAFHVPVYYVLAGQKELNKLSSAEVLNDLQRFCVRP